MATIPLLPLPTRPAQESVALLPGGVDRKPLTQPKHTFSKATLCLAMCLQAAPAHAFVGVIGPGGILGLLLGLLAGVGLGLFVAFRQQQGVSWKRLVAVPAMLVFSVAGGATGWLVGTIADFAFAAYLFRDFGKAAEVHKLPLYQAACSGDLSAVQRQMASPLNRKTREHLPEIAMRCGVHNNPMPPRLAEVFDLLMPPVYRLYVEGQHGDRPGATEDYCDVLDQLMWHRRVDKLQRLQQLNLPLHCRDGHGHLTLLHFLPERRGNAATDEETRRQFEAVLALVGGPQGPLKEAVLASGQSFLDLAVARGEPFFILAALQAGIDPGKPDPSDGQPAVVDWTFLKFRRCIHPETAERLTDTDVAAIDQLMRPPTAEEVNAFDTRRLRAPMLAHLHEFKDCEDGGAAFFRTLRERGADIGVAFSGHEKKFGILHHFDHIKPALLHELEQLTPLELDRLAHPRDPKSGIAGEPLLDTAIRQENTALFKLLCQRGVNRCEPTDSALLLRAQAMKDQLDPLAAAQRRQRAEQAQKVQDAAWQRYNESQQCLDLCLPFLRGAGASACPHCTVVPRPPQPPADEASSVAR